MREFVDTPLSVEMKAQGIPVIDGDKDFAKNLNGLLDGWEVMGKQRAEQAVSVTKVIVAVNVPDWVGSYAKLKMQIPVIIFSTWKGEEGLDFGVGCRFDKGFQMIARQHGYKILTMNGVRKVRGICPPVCSQCGAPRSRRNVRRNGTGMCQRCSIIKNGEKKRLKNLANKVPPREGTEVNDE